jgi:Na+-translocating ferredoxin:NAD+ oxidoreductase RNF subunit RnfB
MASEDFHLRASLKPRSIEGGSLDIRERVSRRRRAEELIKGLPLLNCGLCGAPSCKDHADDVAAGRAELGDCVFLSRDRLELLRAIYKKTQRPI